MATKLTRPGYEKLEKELKHLKEVKRPAVIEAIAKARAHGDLKENAEYDAAREAQGHLEARIAELDDQLSDVMIIETEDIRTDAVYLGAKVSLKEQTKNMELTYTIVSKEEADFKEKKISADSPVGSALIGSKVGDIVEVTLPAGMMRYEVINIGR